MPVENARNLRSRSSSHAKGCISHTLGGTPVRREHTSEGEAPAQNPIPPMEGPSKYKARSGTPIKMPPTVIAAFVSADHAHCMADGASVSCGCSDADSRSRCGRVLKK